MLIAITESLAIHIRPKDISAPILGGNVSGHGWSTRHSKQAVTMGVSTGGRRGHVPLDFSVKGTPIQNVHPLLGPKYRTRLYSLISNNRLSA